MSEEPETSAPAPKESAPPDRPASRLGLMLEKLGVVIGLITAAVGLIVSALNAANYNADRNAQALQASFNNSLAISNVYFEKLAGNADFCTVVEDALLLASIVAKLGRDSSDAAVTEIGVAMNEDFARRTDEHHCPKPNDANPATATSYAIPARIAANLRLLRAQPGPPIVQPVAVTSTTVYIQYNAALDVAQALRDRINREAGFTAPAVEKVARVPQRNELRIFRADDTGRAQSLLAALHVDATVVDLSKLFPSLPAGRMEIWLKDP